MFPPRHLGPFYEDLHPDTPPPLGTLIHIVGVPMFWPGWKDQKMRQHRTTFRPKDLALLGPERDLSMIVKGFMSLKLRCYGFRRVIGIGLFV